MFGGHAGGNRGKHLEKLLHLFSQMPDKEDQRDGGADEASEDKSSPLGQAGKVDMGVHNGPMAGHQTGALPGHGGVGRAEVLMPPHDKNLARR